MNTYQILDCTLRDGGYVNQWNFGSQVIKNIVKSLEKSHIDIIECGFLEDTSYSENCAVFNDIRQLDAIIAPKKPGAMYVAMIALGDIEPDKITPRESTSIDGIRVTFHQHEWEAERATTLKLMEKGYKVFIQPVGSSSYTDKELLELIEKVNELKPYAFYLVDTMGTMYRKDLLRAFYLVDNNLIDGIKIGFHSHNNLQLAFSNAQELLTLDTKRNIIIDSSVFGMGRGAGNLCTELITQYINENIAYKYRVIPLLNIIDQYLLPINAQSRWGYSIPYYLAAIGKCHPNYASYLMEKQTLTIEDISIVLNQIPLKKRTLYNEKFVEHLYLDYQNNRINDNSDKETLCTLIKERIILLLGPGQSIIDERDAVQKFIAEKKPFIIPVNFMPQNYEYDILFFSNVKRAAAFDKTDQKIMVTSNLTNTISSPYLAFNYSTLLGEGRAADNAGTMLIRLLRGLNVQEVFLAGFDGFSKNTGSELSHSQVIQRNTDIGLQFRQIGKDIKLTFLTPTEYKLND